MVKEFIETFRGTKTTLMNFLTIHSRPETKWDDEFFKTFNELVEVLGQRIAFEEENLYSKLESK